MALFVLVGLTGIQETVALAPLRLGDQGCLHHLRRDGTGMFLELLAKDVVGIAIMVHPLRSVQPPQPASENQPIEAAQHAQDNTAETL